MTTATIPFADVAGDQHGPQLPLLVTLLALALLFAAVHGDAYLRPRAATRPIVVRLTKE